MALVPLVNRMKKDVSLTSVYALLALLLIVGAFLTVPVALAIDKSHVSQFDQWQVASGSLNQSNVYQNRVSSAKYFITNPVELRSLLLNINRRSMGSDLVANVSAKAKVNYAIITLPLPNGSFADFKLTPERVVAVELAEKYPQISTFIGHQVGAQQNSGRFDITPNGFHGMFRIAGELVFIEPSASFLQVNEQQAESRNSESQSLYISYYRKDAKQQPNFQRIALLPPKVLNVDVTSQNKPVARSAVTQSTIRTYRLAISAAGEYTAYHGGTVEKGLAALVTLVNRLNDVYQRDLSIKLELVANNDLLIFTDKDTDPFANTSDDGEINTGIIDGLIGSDQYDIGHIVSTGGGGLAVLGAVCRPSVKADGVTGDLNPINDSFYIDYVAHEIGHQFGANHTFNGTEGACIGNRVSSAAYEPGSASTIMSYAGLCGSQNLQNYSDAVFHAKSIEQVNEYITISAGADCGSNATQANNLPVVNAGNDFTIPARTPFVLTGSASDADNDILSYSWEQFDLGAASASSAEQVDDGSRPLFRVWAPVANATRTFPRLQDILANTTVNGETYPTTSRTLNFRLMVRDGNSGNINGGVSFDEMMVTTVDTNEAFAISSPVKNDSWITSSQVIQWNVAQTDLDPISCTAVNILLSVDGGNSFTQTLATNEINDGIAEVTLPSMNTNTARIKIQCTNNIFFAISEGDFSIAVTDGILVNIIGQQNIQITQDTSITLTPSLFSYEKDTASSITVNTGNNYTVSGTTVTPNAGFIGTLMVGVVGHLDTASSDIFVTTITVEPAEVIINITGQQTISLNQGASITLTPSMFSYEKDTATTITVNAGDNYSVSGTQVTPNASFSGTLMVGIIGHKDSISSNEYLATITVIAQPSEEPTKPSSSGGGSVWLLLLSVSYATRRYFYNLKQANNACFCR